VSAPRTRALGYDLRLTGPPAARDREARGYRAREALLAASWDHNVYPPLFVADGGKPEPYQTEIDPKLEADPYFSTFRLFRSDREALSHLAEPEAFPNFSLWAFTLYLPERFEEPIIDGWLRAMDGEVLPEPSLPLAPLGIEVLDDTMTSVTHLYAEIDFLADAPPWQDDPAAHVDWLWSAHRMLAMSIEDVRHPYWTRSARS